MLFYPTTGELNLLDLLSEHKNYCFPITNEDNIIPYKYNGDFCTGMFNICEPRNSIQQDPKQLDLVIMPALCVDRSGNRIGYGKGFYDRLIPDLRCPLVGVGFDFQIVDQVPVEIFDRKLDMVITQNNLFYR